MLQGSGGLLLGEHTLRSPQRGGLGAAGRDRPKGSPLPGKAAAREDPGGRRTGRHAWPPSSSPLTGGQKGAGEPASDLELQEPVLLRPAGAQDKAGAGGTRGEETAGTFQKHRKGPRGGVETATEQEQK